MDNRRRTSWCAGVAAVAVALLVPALPAGQTSVPGATANRPETAPGGGSPAVARLVERLTRVDRTILMYEYTMNDPSIWPRPWTVQVPMTRSEEVIHEYACHEGNYVMPNLLSAARAEEKKSR
jgi:hypothetical protein